MTTPHPDTPELDDILDDLQFESMITDPGDNVTKLRAISTAKASLTRLLAKRELEGRILALECVDADAYYEFEDESRFPVSTVLNELREELAKYE